MTDKFVTLAHGAGGKQTSELIDRVFKEHFANPDLTADDAAVLSMEKGKIAFTTDGFIVSPYEFAGGNIGKLSICGTVNDLSCMGAKPLYLSCAFVIEEGFPMDKLEEIAAAIRRVGLDPLMKKPVGKYSLGMRQRLGIAQAIMEDPALLILDEPLNGLDKHGVREMRQLIKGLKEQGKTILLASHNQGDIDELCDTVCEMDAGVMTMIREESI